jgi:hypothetical protein
MTSMPLRPPPDLRSDLSAAEELIARSVLYAALFDYPLTLAQLRQTLIGSRQTPSEIVATVRDSVALAELIEYRDGYFFPAGRTDLVDIRRHRETRSRAFLAEHRPLLRIIAALPYVRMVALSGSIAHLNLENGGDLDIFLVTSGPRVWSTAVTTVVLAKLLGRRKTLCANFIVADTRLTFEPQDLFTASQLINLKPITGEATFRRIIAANPFVREFYPNFHPAGCNTFRMHQPLGVRALKAAAELVLGLPSVLIERLCRATYRRYLRRRAWSWESPDEVRLENEVLKLHTRSHRSSVLHRYDQAVHRAMD